MYLVRDVVSDRHRDLEYNPTQLKPPLALQAVTYKIPLGFIHIMISKN
jgi:hypothetical protein